MDLRLLFQVMGRVLQVGEPADIYETPRSRAVATFVGDVNLFPGTVRDSAEGRVRVDSETLACRLRCRDARGAVPGDAVEVAVRPEKVRISRKDPENRRENCLTGEVCDIAYLGRMNVFRVRIDSGQTVLAARANRTRSEQGDIACNDRVHLSWDDGAGVVLRE